MEALEKRQSRQSNQLKATPPLVVETPHKSGLQPMPPATIVSGTSTIGFTSVDVTSYVPMHASAIKVFAEIRTSTSTITTISVRQASGMESIAIASARGSFGTGHTGASAEVPIEYGKFEYEVTGAPDSYTLSIQAFIVP